MISDETSLQKSKMPRLATEKLSKNRQRQWARRIKIRATKIKRRLQIENNFHKAMREMCTTTDRYRQSYLHWILNNMFSLFSYETGLQAIHDEAAYEKWLAANGK
jgi:UPF0288 family protein (methanogenesis marker protein 3)